MHIVKTRLHIFNENENDFTRIIARKDNRSSQANVCHRKPRYIILLASFLPIINFCHQDDENEF